MWVSLSGIITALYGIELGPTTPIDLKPGQEINVEFKAVGQDFKNGLPIQRLAQVNTAKAVNTTRVVNMTEKRMALLTQW